MREKMTKYEPKRPLSCEILFYIKMMDVSEYYPVRRKNGGIWALMSPAKTLFEMAGKRAFCIQITLQEPREEHLFLISEDPC